MGKKSGATSVSRVSAASALTAPSTTSSSKKSSITKSAFAPSSLQLHLFASVIQSFESQQLRIHDTINGRLKQQHTTRSGTDITCLNWGYYGSSYIETRLSNKKKRKRLHDTSEGAVVAYGTSASEVCMYSPAEGELVGTLTGAHERGIKDFKFAPHDNLEAWSLGGDGKLVQWDLTKDQPIRHVSLPETGINVLAAPAPSSPQLLCASVTPFTVDVASSGDTQIESFDKYKNPVHTLFRSGRASDDDDESFMAADNDRYINIFDIPRKKIVRTLVTGSEVVRADLFQPDLERKDVLQEQMLAVVTQDGILELFSHPFIQPTYVNGDIKSKRKNLTRRADASVRLIPQDGGGKQIPIFDVSFQGPDLILVSVEGGVEPAFQKLRWQDQGSYELLFEGLKEVIASRNKSNLNTATSNGAKDMGHMKVDEARAVVANGMADPSSQAETIEISSSEEEDDDEEDHVDEKVGDEIESNEDDELDSDVEMDEAEDADDGKVSDQDHARDTQDNQQEDLSFWEMIAAKYPDAISIPDALPTDDRQLTTIPNSQVTALPSGMSLGTVLSQSLRTNDQSLLETCLHASDEGIIQNTILRLDSSLAAILLTKLAERLADRPGRWGHLLTWVQCTMIAHGGAIAAQPAVTSKLRTLYQVLTDRSKILPNILLLKGKLDMMSAQQAFREQAAAQRNISRTNQEEPGMIYIEGQDDNWSSDDDLDEDGKSKQKASVRKPRKNLGELVDDDESSEEDEMPLANGISDSDVDSEEDSEEEDVEEQTAGGLIDSEAEVSGEEDDDEESGEEGDDNSSASEEEDSSMDGFINDDSVSEVEEENDIDLDEEKEDESMMAQRPPTKKSKHKHR